MSESLGCKDCRDEYGVYTAIGVTVLVNVGITMFTVS